MESEKKRKAKRCRDEEKQNQVTPRTCEAAVENLIQIWSEKNLEKTVEWLSNLGAGAVRDAGVAAYARKLAPSSPEAALQWAGRISNPETRDHEFESLIQKWFATDRKAASTWMQTAGLSDQLRNRLLGSP